MRPNKPGDRIHDVILLKYLYTRKGQKYWEVQCALCGKIFDACTANFKRLTSNGECHHRGTQQGVVRSCVRNGPECCWKCKNDPDTCASWRVCGRWRQWFHAEWSAIRQNLGKEDELSE